MRNETKKSSLKIAIVFLVMILVFALTLGAVGAWYRARRSAEGTIKFDSGIVMQYSGFSGDVSQTDWTNEATVELFESTSMLPGSPVNLTNAYINQKDDPTVTPFFTRVKMDYEFFASTAENATPIAPATLAAAGFEVGDLLTTTGIFDTNWTPSNDGWYYYSTNGTDLTALPTTATAIFKTGAHYTIEGDDFGPNNPAEYQLGGAFKVNNSISIAKFKLILVIDAIQASVTNPAAAGWVITNADVITNLTTPLNVKDTSFGSVYDLVNGTPYYYVDNNNKGYSFLYTTSDPTTLSSNGEMNVSPLSVKTLSESQVGYATITGVVGGPTAIILDDKIVINGNDDYITVAKIDFAENATSVKTVVSNVGDLGEDLLIIFPNAEKIYVKTASTVSATDFTDATSTASINIYGIDDVTYTRYELSNNSQQEELEDGIAPLSDFDWEVQNDKIVLKQRVDGEYTSYIIDGSYYVKEDGEGGYEVCDENDENAIAMPVSQIAPSEQTNFDDNAKEIVVTYPIDAVGYGGKLGNNLEKLTARVPKENIEPLEYDEFVIVEKTPNATVYTIQFYNLNNSEYLDGDNEIKLQSKNYTFDYALTDTTNYVFNGWKLYGGDDTLYNTTGLNTTFTFPDNCYTVKFYADWTCTEEVVEDEISISYVDDNGDVLYSTEINRNTDGDNGSALYIINDLTPALSGYTFVGWSDGNGITYHVNDNYNIATTIKTVIFTAIYQETQTENIKINFIVGNNSQSEFTGYSTTVSDRNYTISLNDLTNTTAYDFLGWVDSTAEGSILSEGNYLKQGDTYNIPNSVSSVTFIAQWDLNEIYKKDYKIYYKNLESANAEYGYFNEEHISKIGTFKIERSLADTNSYKFAGWIDTATLDEYAVGSNLSIDANTKDVTILTAKWVKKISNQAKRTAELVGRISIGYKAFVGTAITKVNIPNDINFTINYESFPDGTHYIYNGVEYASLTELKGAMGDSLTLVRSNFTAHAGSGGSSGSQSPYIPRSYTTLEYSSAYGNYVIFRYEDGSYGVDKFTPTVFENITIVDHFNIGGENITAFFQSDCFESSSAIIRGTLTIDAASVSVLRFGANYQCSTVYFTGNAIDGISGAGAENIVSFEAPNLLSIGSLALAHTTVDVGFSACVNLETVNAPNLTHIYSCRAFRGTALKRFNSNLYNVVDIRNVVHIEGYEEINYTDMGAFAECLGIHEVHFGRFIDIGAFAFYGCKNLSRIYFASSGVIGLSSKIGKTETLSSKNNLTLSAYELPDKIWLYDDNENGIEDEGDSYVSVSTESFNGNYPIIARNCSLSINGNPVESSYANGTVLENVLVSVSTGYIDSLLVYYSNGDSYVRDDINLDANEHLKEYVISSITVDGPCVVYAQVGFKYTFDGENFSYAPSIKNILDSSDSGSYDEINHKVKFYQDQQGFKFGRNGEGKHEFTSYDLVLTPYYVDAYKADYYIEDEKVETCISIKSDDHYDFPLPVYGMKNAKYLSGWRTTFGGEIHEYDPYGGLDYFPEKSENVFLDISEDLVFNAILENANATVTFSVGDDRVLFDESTIADVEYYRCGVSYPKIYGYGGWYLEGYDYGGFDNEAFDLSKNVVYNYKTTCVEAPYYHAFDILPKLGYYQEPDVVWTDRYNALEYISMYRNEYVIVKNVNDYTISTGYTSSNSPTSTQTASLTFNRAGFILPDAPVASSQNWIFRGWTYDGASDSQLFAPNSQIAYSYGLLNKTKWKAAWFNVVLNTGYKTGATNVQTAYAIHSLDGINYSLPEDLTPNEGYVFVGWKSSNGDICVSNGNMGTRTICSYNKSAVWDALWAKIDLGGYFNEDLEVVVSDSSTYFSVNLVDTNSVLESNLLKVVGWYDVANNKIISNSVSDYELDYSKINLKLICVRFADQDSYDLANVYCSGQNYCLNENYYALDGSYFIGWSNGNNDLVASSQYIPVKIYEDCDTWECNIATIKFDSAMHEGLTLNSDSNGYYINMPGGSHDIFLNWTAGGNTYTEGEKVYITDDVNFISHYATLSWNGAESGTISSGFETILSDSNGKYILLPDYTPYGDETFIGWEFNGGTVYQAGSKVYLVEGTNEFLVQTSGVSYSVTYKVNGVTYGQVIECDFGDSHIVAAVPNGYDDWFDGSNHWHEGDEIVVTGARVLTAYVHPIIITYQTGASEDEEITGLEGYDPENNPIIVTINQDYVIPYTLSREGYSFLGWTIGMSETLYQQNSHITITSEIVDVSESEGIVYGRSIYINANWQQIGPSYTFNGSTIDQSAYNTKLAWILTAAGNSASLVGEIAGVDENEDPIYFDCDNELSSFNLDPFAISDLIGFITSNVNIDSYAISYSGSGSIHITLSANSQTILDLAIDIAKVEDQENPGSYNNYVYSLVANIYVDPSDDFAYSATPAEFSQTLEPVEVISTIGIPLTAEEIYVNFGVRCYFENGVASTQSTYEAFKHFILDTCAVNTDGEMNLYNGLATPLAGIESDTDILMINVRYAGNDNVIFIDFCTTDLLSTDVIVKFGIKDNGEGTYYLYNATINPDGEEEQEIGPFDELAEAPDTTIDSTFVSTVINPVIPEPTPVSNERIYTLGGNSSNLTEYEAIMNFLGTAANMSGVDLNETLGEIPAEVTEIAITYSNNVMTVSYNVDSDAAVVVVFTIVTDGEYNYASSIRLTVAETEYSNTELVDPNNISQIGETSDFIFNSTSIAEIIGE